MKIDWLNVCVFFGIVVLTCLFWGSVIYIVVH